MAEGCKHRLWQGSAQSWGQSLSQVQLIALISSASTSQLLGNCLCLSPEASLGLGDSNKHSETNKAVFIWLLPRLDPVLGVQATTVKSNFNVEFNCHRDSGVGFQFVLANIIISRTHINVIYCSLTEPWRTWFCSAVTFAEGTSKLCSSCTNTGMKSTRTLPLHWNYSLHQTPSWIWGLGRAAVWNPCPSHRKTFSCKAGAETFRHGAA